MTNKRKISKPLIIGLTGSIGMGKSTAAKIFRGFGLPVYNADQAVHALLAKGGKGVKPVARLFPDTLRNGAIDRRALGHQVFTSPAKLRRLENILHPLVQQAERAFVNKARQKKVKAGVLEIPLLFETKANRRCDVTICVTAPQAVQKERVMRRPDMTAAKFRAILKLQMPDREKRRRADHIISTAKSTADTRRQLTRLWAGLQKGIT